MENRRKVSEKEINNDEKYVNVFFVLLFDRKKGFIPNGILQSCTFSYEEQIMNVNLTPHLSEAEVFPSWEEAQRRISQICSQEYYEIPSEYQRRGYGSSLWRSVKLSSPLMVKISQYLEKREEGYKKYDKLERELWSRHERENRELHALLLSHEREIEKEEEYLSPMVEKAYKIRHNKIYKKEKYL